MNDIQRIISILKSNNISGEETYFIDKVLSETSHTLIPMEEADSVLNYINLQLANNSVDIEVRLKMTLLYDSIYKKKIEINY